MGDKKKIKKLTSTNQELSKALSALRGQLTRAETKLARSEDRSERWKKDAIAARTAASRSDARLAKLQKKLDRASDAQHAATTSPSPGQTITKETPTDPDQTWTVAQLRAEARVRGLSGLSGKPKAQLLAALTRDA